jgi:hypothetical protein
MANIMLSGGANTSGINLPCCFGEGSYPVDEKCDNGYKLVPSNIKNCNVNCCIPPSKGYSKEHYTASKKSKPNPVMWILYIILIALFLLGLSGLVYSIRVMYKE